MTLKPLIGHQKPLQDMVKMAVKKNFPHAILLAGSKGIGKRLLAETIGKFLLCGGTNESNQVRINNSSPFIPQIEAKSCPDWHIVEVQEKAKTIKIEQVRELLNKLALASDNKRIIIIDSADEMGVEAANALLKSLEEPGKNIHFIIISHNHFKLLPTIISRCRKIRLSSLSTEETEQVLTANSNLDFESVQQLAANANGSPGQALALGEVGLDISAQLENVFNGSANATLVADKLNQKKQVLIALDILMQKIAKSTKTATSLKTLNSYEELQSLQRKLLTHNISANWALEQALRKLQD